MVCQTLCQNNVAAWGSLEENEESNCPITTVTTPQKMVVGTTSNIIQHQKSWPTQQLIKPAPFASAPFHWARSDPWFQHPPSWRRASPSVAPCVLAPPCGCAQHALAGAGAGANVAIPVLFLSMEFMEAENIWKNMEKNGAIQPEKHRHSGAKQMNSTVLGMVHGSYHDPNQQGNGSCESQVMSTTWLPQRASKNRRSRPKS